MTQPTTNLREWRHMNMDAQEAILQLGSGLRIHVRKAPMLELVESGAIPTDLTNQVATLIDHGITGFDRKTLVETLKAVNIVVKTMSVQPKIADQPDDDHIGIAEIRIMDRLSMYAWAQRGVAPFRSFPVKREQSAHSPGD